LTITGTGGGATVTGSLVFNQAWAAAPFVTTTLIGASINFNDFQVATITTTEITFTNNDFNALDFCYHVFGGLPATPTQPYL